MNKTILLILLLASLKSIGQKRELNITIDERIETIYSIAFLDNYFLVSNHDNLYKSKLKNNFKDLRNHKAVALFDTLSKKHGFNFNNVTDWMLQFDKFPELNTVREVINPDSFDESKGDYLIKKFKKELISFNQDSLFQAYLIEVKELNEKVINQVKQSKSIQHLPAYLENYYGSELGSYNLILSPLVHSGGFNSKFITAGKKEVYAIIGPNGEIEHIPYFEKEYLEMDMILHEFGHSFVNPLTDKFQNEIETIKEKYYTESLKKDGKAQAYGEWKYLYNELVIRAITIRIANKYFGKEKAKELLNYEKSIGFSLVGNIVEILKEYENNRGEYLKLSDFYPILIERIK
ncbi:DUF4932 domain-containing protein [Polaribacter vadi]|uniref:DUF4932 domain-containing protein n=1 Tax=Polaribacter TaxID=52959 RepID=UPI001C08C3CE|nr:MULTISPECIES: DUF4932 domain-containing protein [Polaribacter]MBU3012339.1 DUF4932 domain-containing protein [Polaribacter vadi]MDO6742156.1 DUF4932 domain-containing protein [Polaribacter sp. 1_MG-2023]